MTTPSRADPRKSARRPIAGTGRVLLWPGGSLWIGRGIGRAQMHAHHAIQITLAITGSFLMRGEHDAEGNSRRGTIVMPHRHHQFDGCGHAVAVLFVEPETLQGRALLAQYRGNDVSDLAEERVTTLVAPLRIAFDTRSDNETLIAAGRHAIARLAGPTSAEGELDARIGRAIGWMRARLGDTISLPQAAGVAHLSPSRFRHLFVAHTGISFRAYLLWARVEFAVGAAMAGTSWTVAAQEAGFADSAHLSRTCRRMIGLAPASLVREASMASGAG
jgi:AraC-like DNA-binding protein